MPEVATVGNPVSLVRLASAIVGKPFVREEDSILSEGVIKRIEFLGGGTTAALYGPTRKICTVNCQMQQEHEAKDKRLKITRRNGDTLTVLKPRIAAS